MAKADEKAAAPAEKTTFSVGDHVLFNDHTKKPRPAVVTAVNVSTVDEETLVTYQVTIFFPGRIGYAPHAGEKELQLQRRG